MRRKNKEEKLKENLCDRSEWHQNKKKLQVVVRGVGLGMRLVVSVED